MPVLKKQFWSGKLLGKRCGGLYLFPEKKVGGRKVLHLRRPSPTTPAFCFKHMLQQPHYTYFWKSLKMNQRTTQDIALQPLAIDLLRCIAKWESLSAWPFFFPVVKKCEELWPFITHQLLNFISLSTSQHLVMNGIVYHFPFWSQGRDGVGFLPTFQQDLA